ncbi:gamma-glutamyltranspeptidase / glutathione hydrolase [Roseomonas rosea]|uniref:Glutathione hydrolase proenzyme n=1 Tax=Muricoccus roseus TaxID=198092 RepID=A0A1M6E5G1_9PROT|nr:gamma-glutamyltransferase [Roseomonas rosea]SHI80681.1 gamma-glutamyltranspeptidase / glutathione hydrolase [Roseomonas rosea]
MTEKHPVTAHKGMVVTNHPLASAAGSEMLLAGGNAVDAAIAALFTLTVVEPMMVGILGGGVAHLRLPDGRHVVVDGLSTAPAAARPDMYRTVSDVLPDYQETVGRQNHFGPLAMAVPGALRAWCHTLSRYGTLPLADVLEPAIRCAARGWRATPYLADAVGDNAKELATDEGLAAIFLPQGTPIRAGDRVLRPDYADTLRLIAAVGPDALHDGQLGDALAAHMRAAGGLITAADLHAAAPVEREAIRAFYRGHEVIGPPPPSSAGVHIAQMLHVLEGFDLRALGTGSADAVHLLAEALKMAFADRAVATADPAFVEVPVAQLTARDYAEARRGEIDMAHARDWAPGAGLMESANTTHVTVADGQGTIIATTQTINSLFGARFTVPGTGMVANNYMYNFDPHPGKALSVAPGKRVFTSMAPMMVLKDGKPVVALGLPGGLRIFGSAMQAIINLLDHRMSLQEAVEAPRVWSQGHLLELEPGISTETEAALVARGHRTLRVPTVGGGMGAVAFGPDGTLTGAACWRADGTPVGIGGGLARPGVRFVPEQRP